MSAADLTAALLEPVRSAVQGSQTLSLLVGAGASAEASLPTWGEFTLKLIMLSKIASSREDAAAFLNGQDVLLALEAARSTSTETVWITRLRKALYGNDAVPTPSSTHRAIADLFAQPPAAVTAVNCATLNYDTLLEAALDEVGIPAVPANSPSDSGKHVHVRHLHGVLPEKGKGEHQSIVLTLKDYLVLLSQPSPWQAHVLHDYRYKGPLLLIGTSYSDMDVRQWFESFTSNEPYYPVLNFLSREGLGLSKAQFEAVLPALRTQWQSLGITLVPIQDHADAAQILQELPTICDTSYIAPMQRIAEVYAAHSGAAFGDVQKAYAAELDKHHVAASGVVDGDTNATLWLADGSGNLLRWATSGRLYMDETQLRRVPAQHDSTWAVAKCFSRAAPTAWRDEEKSPDGPSRWRTVVASPIKVSGTVRTLCGVLTMASTKVLAATELEALAGLCEQAAIEWAARVEATHATA